ncbi:MAG: hypothetical protein WCY27_01735 [archaeon]|jgi:1-deoxy-D-xylulose 5-phosphate reductoisomerase|nr:hypothetical protein [archaeon]MDD2477452.1 hypothetical protein [Candidatus ainarchaeum sp.]MDD3084735.1 hypothetical protein [Candidatus ainarchaeum sp.]MDD4220984.1 hypothetical protein [Candidatus ainarchaeum sp.]MDD4662444.1 hypothetical protein [Candidatus ainarchaeum sp.]
MIKNIVILGSNNKFGCSIISFFKNYPNVYSIYGLTYDSKRNNIDEFIEQVNTFNCKRIYVNNKIDAEYIESKVNAKIFVGYENFINFIKSTDIDQVVSTLSGIISVKKILSVIHEFKDLTLLNTSPLLYSGNIIPKEAISKGIKLDIVSYPAYSIAQFKNNRNILDIRKINLFTTFKKKKLLPTYDYDNLLDYIKAYNSTNNIRILNDLFLCSYLYNIDPNNFDFFYQDKKLISIILKFKEGGSIIYSANKNLISIYNYYFLRNLNVTIKDTDDFDCDKLSFKVEKIDLSKEKYLSLGLSALKKGGSLPILFYITTELFIELLYNNRILKNVELYTVLKKILDDPTLYKKYPDLSSIYAFENKINDILINNYCKKL